jgi:hypothetical protein
MTQSENALTSASSTAQNLYCSLLASLGPMGPFQEELKKTSVHLVRGSAFAGVQLRREYLIVTIKSEKPIRSARITKGEQVSKHRWHNEVKISSEADFDRELLVWLKGAYDFAVEPKTRRA